jgi:hypothetical protein
MSNTQSWHLDFSMVYRFDGEELVTKGNDDKRVIGVI